MTSENDENTAAGPEERRRRRKERILAGNDKRMSAILNITGEKRLAPCIEGGDPVAASSKTQSSSSITKAMDKRRTSKQQTPEPNNVERDHFLSRVRVPLSQPDPRYIEVVNNARFWVALFLGLLLAILSTMFDRIGNVLLPVLILIFTYEALVFKTKRSLYSKQNQFFGAIVAEGLGNNVLNTFGLLINVLRDISSDLILVAFGFLTTRILQQNAVKLL